MSLNKVAWVMMGPGENEATCERCQQKHTFQLPAVVTEFIKDLEGFSQLHSRCLPPEKGGEVKITVMTESLPSEPLAPRSKAKKRRKKKGGRR